MSTLIINGLACREALMPLLISRVQALSSVPTLAIIQVGNRPDSSAFIRAKKAFAAKIGVKEKHIQLPEEMSQLHIIEKIRECNDDPNIQGIIVQLPLPHGIDREAVIEAIDPCKDADALTSIRMKCWVEGHENAIMPATARGIRELLQHYKITLIGKKVVVIGRSMLVGKPIALMCLNENATVTLCHSKTPDLAREVQNSDIVIVATGKPGLITASHVRAGQTIIDVGMTKTEESSFVGDVDFAGVKDTVAAISPVPGGVGPMTVYALFENLIDLCSKK